MKNLAAAGLAVSAAVLLATAAFIQPADAGATYSWTGCYVGANAGYGWADNEATALRDVLVGTVFNDNVGSATATGGAIGGQLGCDRQTGQWVWGGQASLNAADLNGKHRYITGAPTDHIKYHIDAFATATARIGYLFWEDTLPYINAGLAWTNTNYNDTDPSPPVGPYTGDTTKSRFGEVIGFGVEHRLKGRFSIFAEYNYMHFGKEDVRIHYSDGPIYDYSFKQNMNVVKFGVNYRF